MVALYTLGCHLHLILMVTWGRCFCFSYFVDRETGIETVSNFPKLSVGTTISAWLLTLETKHRQEEGILPVSQNHLETFLYFAHEYTCKSVGGQREELRPWQRSWGRRISIRKGGIEPQETPCSRASTPQTRVCLLYCFMLSPTPLTLWGAVPHLLSQRRS